MKKLLCLKRSNSRIVKGGQRSTSSNQKALFLWKSDNGSLLVGAVVALLPHRSLIFSTTNVVLLHLFLDWKEDWRWKKFSKRSSWEINFSSLGYCACDCHFFWLQRYIYIVSSKLLMKNEDQIRFPLSWKTTMLHDRRWSKLKSWFHQWYKNLGKQCGFYLAFYI